MTDLEAIRQYMAAVGEREALLDAPAPEIYTRDPAGSEQYSQILRRALEIPEAIIKQAERSVDQLPRPEWREAMTNRFLLGLDSYETAEAMAYSVRSVFRFEQEAVAFLESRENKTPQNGPEREKQGVERT